MGVHTIFFAPNLKKRKEKKGRNKNNHKNSGHFVPQSRQQAAHALRSDQFSVTRISNSGPNGIDFEQIQIPNIFVTKK